MLGGMVFATSSSVNTTLNISAGVFSNDIYKNFRPSATSKELVRVGKISTIVLGLITIVVALFVPYLGGVVEFIFSLAAITGGAMFLPPLWALFSKRQTGKSVLIVTITSLLINGFLKFLAPSLLDFGVGIPIITLIITEIVYSLRKEKNHQYIKYTENIESLANITDNDESTSGNKKGSKVIGIGVASTGVLIFLLSIIAENGALLVGSTGGVVLILGLYIIYKNK